MPAARRSSAARCGPGSAAHSGCAFLARAAAAWISAAFASPTRASTAPVAGSTDVSSPPRGATHPSLLRERVTAYIRARLEDPRLSRGTIAAAHRMSPRTLDRLFSGQDWSVSGYIRHERLEAVRRDLENPALAHHGVAALAARWCFFDAAHFSRLFREAYGYPPSQARPG
jgi:transcriptional regulator GlxA family with amidase domain